MDNANKAKAPSPSRLAPEGDRASTVAKLRVAMQLAYDGGQLSLAKSIFQAIVEVNCRYYDAIARASTLPTTIDDNELGRIVRNRANARNH